MTLVHRVLDAEPVADLVAYLAAGAGGHSSLLLGDFQPYQRHLGIVAGTFDLPADSADHDPHPHRTRLRPRAAPMVERIGRADVKTRNAMSLERESAALFGPLTCCFY